MEQTKSSGATIRLIGALLLALAVIVGCSMLAKSFETNYYAAGGSSFPGEFTAHIEDGGMDYLGEHQAIRYVGLAWEMALWDFLLESGALDGTFITFELPPKEEGGESGLVRVYSRARLDAWMQAQFEQPQEP